MSVRLLALPLLALGARAPAQEEAPYRAETFVAVDRVAPGRTFRVAVRLEIEEGWHAQSHKPLDPAFVATELELAKDSGFALREVVFPPGRELDLAALGGRASVYEGTVLIGATVEAGPDLPAGPARAKGRLHVQACDDKFCRSPEWVPLEFPIEIGPGEAKPQHAAIFSSIDFSKAEPVTGARGAAPGASGPGTKEEKGLLATLLGIFLLGLALNLTPCVYPVIAVTIGYFGRQAQGRGRLLLPVCYALGIAVTFTALGVVAALTGGAFGAWLQNRWVLLGLSLLIVAFALSCFGLFEINAPTWLLSKVGGGKAGAVGALLMGLTMGVTAAPCVGPLILTLIVAVAKEQSVAKGLLWFGTLSAGLALPYVFLGAFSGSVSTLPKAGDWTEWVKKLLGFVLLAVAIWFANPSLPEGVLLPALAAVAVAGGAWLALFEKTGRATRALWALRIAVGLFGLASGSALYARSRAEGIMWRPYDPALLAQARAERRPVLIDVTARWCLPCKLMEETTFKDADVIRETAAFERLKVDLTSEDPGPAVQDALRRFAEDGRLDPPQLIFFDAEGKEMKALRSREKVGAEDLLLRLQQARRGSP
ncbi:MAG TPA: cytochrome c biogenesis protein CcdA [Planctomycetota bacterium]|jgi:thiol:disulfide interchange protein DsbD|nr:cytochrome c biogenesis protein CcdA [Planctomycetota bacterium]